MPPKKYPVFPPRYKHLKNQNDTEKAPNDTQGHLRLYSGRAERDYCFIFFCCFLRGTHPRYLRCRRKVPDRSVSVSWFRCSAFARLDSTHIISDCRHGCFLKSSNVSSGGGGASGGGGPCGTGAGGYCWWYWWWFTGGYNRGGIPFLGETKHMALWISRKRLTSWTFMALVSQTTRLHLFSLIPSPSPTRLIHSYSFDSLPCSGSCCNQTTSLIGKPFIYLCSLCP